MAFKVGDLKFNVHACEDDLIPFEASLQETYSNDSVKEKETKLLAKEFTLLEIIFGYCKSEWGQFFTNNPAAWIGWRFHCDRLWVEVDCGGVTRDDQFVRDRHNLFMRKDFDGIGQHTKSHRLRLLLRCFASKRQNPFSENTGFQLLWPIG